MMQSDALPASTLDMLLPPARSKMPTLPFELEEYARLSCLPDADDELIFEAGLTLATITERVPHLSDTYEVDARLTELEALMLSLVDGTSPVSTLVELFGTGQGEALVAVCDLYARGLLAFD
jgi:hypothetical protein